MLHCWKLLLYGRGRDGHRDAAKTPIARMEIADSALQIGGVEIGPHALGEMQFGVGAFPEEKIAEPLLSSGANQQIHVGEPSGAWVTSAMRFENSSCVTSVAETIQQAACNMESRAE